MSVVELDALVERHVRAIVDAACSSSPGGNPAWDKVLENYKVAPASAVDRVKELEKLGMTRGAVPSEVTRALSAVQVWARGELSSLVAAAGGVSDPQAAALETRLAGLVASETSRYKAAVVPDDLVGSIFAEATAQADAGPWANAKVSASKVLTCVHCGAPQEAALDFVCRYCKKPMLGESGT